MGENSKIEWTDHTMNFWIGCQEVSPACDHCYARVQNEHWKWVAGWGPHGERRRTSAGNWQKLRKWNRDAKAAGVRPKVFANSLSDFFDNKVEPDWRNCAWHLIAECSHLDFLILTKRPQNISGMLPQATSIPVDKIAGPWPWPNVWLGCTVENQEEADRRIPHLLAVPAAVRFLSCEPLLGPVDLRPWLSDDDGCEGCDDGGVYQNRCERSDIPREEQCPRGHAVFDTAEGPMTEDGPEWVTVNRVTVDWVIAGNESGPNRRPGDLAHMRSLRDQCGAAGVPFFGKQDDKVKPLPEDLLIRQFPQVLQ